MGWVAWGGGGVVRAFFRNKANWGVSLLGGTGWSGPGRGGDGVGGGRVGAFGRARLGWSGRIRGSGADGCVCPSNTALRRKSAAEPDQAARRKRGRLPHFKQPLPLAAVPSCGGTAPCGRGSIPSGHGSIRGRGWRRREGDRIPRQSRLQLQVIELQGIGRLERRIA